MSVPQIAIDAVSHYLGKGVPRGPAVGIVAVLYAGESQLGAGSQGTQASETGGTLNPRGAYGVASWNGPRQDALAAFAALKGLPVALMTTQLDFILTEIFNSYPRTKAAYLAALPYAQFIPIFVADYERPASPAAEIVRSVAFAQTLDAVVAAAPVVVAAPPAAIITPPPAYVPAATGPSTMDPAIVIAIVEAMTAGFARALIAAQSQALPVAAPVAAVPAPVAAAPFDLGALVALLTPILTSALGATLPGLIAIEIARIIPAAVAAKA